MGADEATLDWYATWVTLKEGTSRPLFGVDACQDKANLIKIDEYTSVLTVTATNDQNQTLDVTVTWEYRDDEYSYGYFYTYGGHKIDVMSRIPPTSELVLMACNGTIVSYDPSLEPYGTHWRGAGEA
jgi:hypothetical protein